MMRTIIAAALAVMLAGAAGGQTPAAPETAKPNQENPFTEELERRDRIRRDARAAEEVLAAMGLPNAGTARFHCGKEWITFPQARLVRNLLGTHSADSLWLTIRKAEIESVYVWPSPSERGSLAGAVYVIRKAGDARIVPRAFHRPIVECLD